VIKKAINAKRRQITGFQIFPPSVIT